MYILEGDEMLIAMADSQLVNATELIRQKTIPKQLVCPCCQQPVIYKHGDRRIAHFSHKSNAICAGFSEGESQAHLKGKLAFKQQLEKMGQAAVLEYHLPTIEQRADVLLPDQQLILEYQCSPISYSDISRRTSNYKSLGYDVLWILGDRHLNAVNRLDGVAKFARFQPRLGFFIVYYSADRRQLKLHYHIQEVAGKVVSSVQFFKSLSDLKRFMDAHETPKQPVSSPFQARQSMLNQLQRIHRSNVLQNPTYRDMVTACYEQGKLFIGCPLICHGKWGEGMPIFKRTILCWRVWVVLQLFQPVRQRFPISGSIKSLLNPFSNLVSSLPKLTITSVSFRWNSRASFSVSVQTVISVTPFLEFESFNHQLGLKAMIKKDAL